MSVLIHMKMPEHCFVCPCTKDWQNTYVCKITGLPATYDGRARGCPLIDVPEPHGRLVDADALHEAMYHRAFETDGDTMWQSGCWVRYRAIEQVHNAQPTVIPASEDGE